MVFSYSSHYFCFMCAFFYFFGSLYVCDTLSKHIYIKSESMAIPTHTYKYKHTFMHNRIRPHAQVACAILCSLIHFDNVCLSVGRSVCTVVYVFYIYGKHIKHFQRTILLLTPSVRMNSNIIHNANCIQIN